LGAVRVYVLPFINDFEYSSEWLEITEDVISVGDIQMGVDNAEFDIGTVRNSSVKVTLRNDNGRYTASDNLKSIFRFKRKDVLSRITFDRRAKPLRCGFFLPGREILSEEILLFDGVIREIDTKSGIKAQQIEIGVMGFESLLDSQPVPYSSVNGSGTYAQAIYTCLNTPPFNALVSVDPSKIVTGLPSLELDTKVELENKTIGEILSGLLLDSKSVFFLRNGEAIVSPRTATDDVKKEFFGQASVSGIENILDIPNYRDGVNRVKNYWTWAETVALQQDSSSVSTYGVQKKELSSETILTTSTSKINSILASYLTDFRDPRRELELLTPLDPSTISLNILDKVTVDYPTVYVPADNNVLPRYGLDAYGFSRYPFGKWDLQIDPQTTSFKIMGKKISTSRNIVTLRLREI
jgi:hypothetical protein